MDKEISKYFDPESVFKEQVGFIRQYKLRTYAKADIDLTVVRSDAEYNIAGNNLAVVKLDAACYIKFNEKSNPKLDLREQREILDAPFYRFFITNDAAAAGSECKLRIGRASLFRVVPVGTTGITDSDRNDINPATKELFIPLEKAAIHGTTKVADTDILATDLSPTNTPCLFRIMVMLETAGLFSAMLKNGAVTKKLKLNSGTLLTVDCAYVFDILVHSGDTVNFQTSVGGDVTMRVQEIVGGVQ